MRRTLRRPITPPRHRPLPSRTPVTPPGHPVARDPHHSTPRPPARKLRPHQPHGDVPGMPPRLRPRPPRPKPPTVRRHRRATRPVLRRRRSRASRTAETTSESRRRSGRPARNDSTGTDDRFPFATAHRAYLDAGWAPIPLPTGAKYPPPGGVTGDRGRPPRPEQITRWLTDGYTHKVGDEYRPILPPHNIGVRLDGGVIGIDVDHYADKAGADELAALETAHGPLPPTWCSTARGDDDGPGLSRILFYRVPNGTRLKANPAPAIEIVQRHHRYAVVWPSVNPKTGTVYRWYDDTGEDADRPPYVDQLADLPWAWLEALRPSAPAGPRPPQRPPRSSRRSLTPTPCPNAPRCSMASTLAWNNFRPAPAATTPSLRWPVGRCAKQRLGASRRGRHHRTALLVDQGHRRRPPPSDRVRVQRCHRLGRGQAARTAPASRRSASGHESTTRPPSSGTAFGRVRRRPDLSPDRKRTSSNRQRRRSDHSWTPTSSHPGPPTFSQRGCESTSAPPPPVSKCLSTSAPNSPSAPWPASRWATPVSPWGPGANRRTSTPMSRCTRRRQEPRREGHRRPAEGVGATSPRADGRHVSSRAGQVEGAPAEAPQGRTGRRTRIRESRRARSPVIAAAGDKPTPFRLTVDDATPNASCNCSPSTRRSR